MKTRGATSEGCTACCGAEACRVTRFRWAYELKTNVCWQQKPKKKGDGSSWEAQKLGKEVAGVADHKNNAYFYFSLKEQSRKTVSLKQTLEWWSKSDLYEPVWNLMCTDLISHCHQKGQDWLCCTCPKPPLHCHQQKQRPVETESGTVSGWAWVIIFPLDWFSAAPFPGSCLPAKQGHKH